MATVPLLQRNKPVRYPDAVDTSGQAVNAMNKAADAYKHQSDVLRRFSYSMREAYEESETTRAITSASKELNTYLSARFGQRYNQDGNPTFNELLPDIEKAASDIYDETVSTLFLGSSKTRFQNEYARLTEKTLTLAGAEARKQLLDHTTATHMASVESIGNQAIQTQDVNELFKSLKDIETTTTKQMQNGLYSPTTAQKFIREHSAKLTRAFFSTKVREEPEEAELILRRETAEHLGILEGTRNYYIDLAVNRIAQQEKIKNDLLKEELTQQHYDSVALQLEHGLPVIESKKVLSAVFDQQLARLKQADPEIDNYKALAEIGRFHTTEQPPVTSSIVYGITASETDADMKGAFNLWKSLNNRKNSKVIAGISKEAQEILITAERAVNNQYTDIANSVRQARLKLQDKDIVTIQVNKERYSIQKQIYEKSSKIRANSFTQNNGAMVANSLGLKQDNRSRDEQFGMAYKEAYEQLGQSDLAVKQVADTYQGRVLKSGAGERSMIDPIELVADVNQGTARSLFNKYLYANRERLPRNFNSYDYGLVSMAGQDEYDYPTYQVVVKGKTGTRDDSVVISNDTGIYMRLVVPVKELKLQESLQEEANRHIQINKQMDALIRQEKLKSGEGGEAIVSEKAQRRQKTFNEAEQIRKQADSIYRYDAHGKLQVNESASMNAMQVLEKIDLTAIMEKMDRDTLNSLLDGENPAKAIEEATGFNLGKLYGSEALGVATIKANVNQEKPMELKGGDYIEAMIEDLKAKTLPAIANSWNWIRNNIIAPQLQEKTPPENVSTVLQTQLDELSSKVLDDLKGLQIAEYNPNYSQEAIDTLLLETEKNILSLLELYDGVDHLAQVTLTYTNHPTYALIDQAMKEGVHGRAYRAIPIEFKQYAYSIYDEAKGATQAQMVDFWRGVLARDPPDLEGKLAELAESLGVSIDNR